VERRRRGGSDIAKHVPRVPGAPPPLGERASSVCSGS
jgi:hypothetical protein